MVFAESAHTSTVELYDSNVIYPRRLSHVGVARGGLEAKLNLLCHEHLEEGWQTRSHLQS